MAEVNPTKGRPSKYTDEIADKIVLMLSDGTTLRSICRMDGFPHWTTVYDWMDKNPSFSLRIAHAREMGFDAIAEETLEIANTPCYLETKETTDDGSGKPPKVKIVVADAFNHRRLQVDTRLKLLAKWNPKKYGDQVQFDTENQNWTVNGIPVKTNK